MTRISGRRPHAALAIALLVILFPQTPAAGTFTHCIRNNGNLSFFLQSDAIDIRIFVNADGEFKWEDLNTHIVTDCEDATVKNIDKVFLDDGTGDMNSPTVVLDYRRSWGPGATPEKSGKSEIEADIEFSLDTADDLRIVGGRRRDRIVFGSNGINVTRDRDRDVFVTGAEFFYAQGRGNPDFMSGAGGFGTGQLAEYPITLQGDGGSDQLIGGRGPDLLRGLSGNDESRGRGGEDAIFSDEGNDLLKGGGGGDELDGELGRDRLRGQSGPDDLEGGGGPDDLDGGPGNDKCRGGPGDDSVENCES
jgi:Ca2+-binding RTX toxin-like protein